MDPVLATVSENIPTSNLPTTTCSSGKTTDLLQPHQMVRPGPELIEVLRTVTEITDVISGAQLLTALISYIRENRLYDPENVKHVYCGNDRLGEVLGVTQFTRDNIKSILMKYVTVESDEQSSQPDTDATDSKLELSPKVHYTLQQSTIPQGSLREFNQDYQSQSKDKETANLPKKRRHTSSSSSDKELSTLPWYFSLQQKSSSSVNSNDVFTINSEDTAVIGESSDDLWFLDEDAFAVEFEVLSDDSDNQSDGSYSSSSSPYEDIDLNSGEVMLFMSDNELSCTDSENSHVEKWACVECSFNNSPGRRYCSICWALRKGWLSHETDHRGNPRKRPFRRSLSDPCPSTGLSFDEPGACPITMALSNHSPVCSKESWNPQPEELRRSDTVVLDVGSEPGVSTSRPDTDIPRLLTIETTSSGYQSQSSDIPRLLPTISSRTLPSEYPSPESTPPNPPAVTRTDTPTPRTTTETPATTSSQASLDMDNSNTDNSQDQCCIICMSAPKNGCMVHMAEGIGHILCCYKCARKLEKKGKACPLCRRTDYTVIKTFTY